MKIAGSASSAAMTASTSASSTWKRIIGRVAVVVGLAAAAIIERDDAARLGAVVRQRGGERFEIGGRAGEAGQADHRQSRRARRWP